MDERVANLTEKKLNEMVCKAYRLKEMTLAGWHIEPIYGGTGGAIGGTALYRIRADANGHGSCSIVLKVLYKRPGELVSSPYYWKREFEVYRSGMLENLPDIGFDTPNIYHLENFIDACWIWMEDIPTGDARWSLSDYRQVARRLGRFNGAYLVGRPIPEFNWLSDQWHCAIIPALADVLDHLDQFIDAPLMQRALPIEDLDRILEIWHDRDLFSEALCQLPQTLCHYDVFQKNLFRSTESAMLIDWALAGRGVIGEELVCLVAVSLYYRDVDNFEFESFDQAIFAGYMSGLRDAGWQGDADLARLGYVCGMVLRGLAGVKQDFLLLQDEGNFPELIASQSADSIEEVADLFAEIRQIRLIQMAQEARVLIKKLGL